MSNRMHMFRKQAGNSGEGLLNLLSHSFLEVLHIRLVFSEAVLLALYPQMNALALGVVVFLLIVGIAAGRPPLSAYT